MASSETCDRIPPLLKDLVPTYYRLLRESPQRLSLYFEECSMFGRPDADGTMRSVTTRAAIKNKILSLDYIKGLEKLNTVHDQYSLDRGRVILVTGYIISQHNVKRNFTQVLFFSFREKKGSYHILHDMLRFLDDTRQPPSTRGKGDFLIRLHQDGATGWSSIAPKLEMVFMLNYYRLLRESPNKVLMFYKGGSRIGRPDSRGDVIFFASKLAIENMILLMSHYTKLEEIKTLDSQHSFNGGVLVLVTGRLLFGGCVERNFTQSFFLAPDHEGQFYVLNDALKILDEDGPLGVPIYPNEYIMRKSLPLEEDLVATFAIPGRPLFCTEAAEICVLRYYRLLHSSPEKFCFSFANSCVFGRPDVHGMMSSVTTRLGIREKILSFDYIKFKEKINGVYAQWCLNGGFLALLTGYLISEDNAQNNFTQALLFPRKFKESKVCYLANDMLRFFGDTSPPPYTQRAGFRFWLPMLFGDSLRLSDQSVVATCSIRAPKSAIAFVHNYYRLLGQSTDEVFLFYKDSSRVSRPDLCGIMVDVTGKTWISNMMLLMDRYIKFKEIKTVDAQPSPSGSLVLVTGWLIFGDHSRKNFTQLFLLALDDATQFYIANDILMILHDDHHHQGVKSVNQLPSVIPGGGGGDASVWLMEEDCSERHHLRRRHVPSSERDELLPW